MRRLAILLAPILAITMLFGTNPAPAGAFPPADAGYHTYQELIAAARASKPRIRPWSASPRSAVVTRAASSGSPRSVTTSGPMSLSPRCCSTAVTMVAST